MSDPHQPHEAGQREEDLPPEPGGETEEEYDQPYSGIPPGMAAPFRPWPGAVRAFLFFTAAMIVAAMGTEIGLTVAARVTGQRLPTGAPEVVQQAFTRPAFIFWSGLFSLIFIVLLTALCARLWDRRSLTSVGLQLDAAAMRQFGFGLALGAALIVVVFAVEAALGWLTVTEALPPSRWPAYILLWFLALLPAAAYEEVMLRGYTFQALEQQWGGAVATVVTAVAFGALHAFNPGAGWSSFWGIVASGFMFGIAYLVTRRLWLPIGLHIGWNLSEGPVLGFPLSGIDFPSAVEPVVRGPALWTGGPFGPEAGLLGLLATAAGAAVLLLLRRKLNPPPEANGTAHPVPAASNGP